MQLQVMSLPSICVCWSTNHTYKPVNYYHYPVYDDNHHQVLEKTNQKSQDTAADAVSAFNLCVCGANHTRKPVNHCNHLVDDDLPSSRS